MTPDKRALITVFMANPGLIEAMKSVLLESISPIGIDRFISTLDRTIPDAIYGQQVKMRTEATKLLEDGFAQLTKVANARRVYNQARTHLANPCTPLACPTTAG
jgi:hypothetical protein